MYSILLSQNGRLHSVCFDSKLDAIRYILVFCGNDFSLLYGFYYSIDGNVVNIKQDFLYFLNVS